MKTKLILIITVVAAHLLASCDESPTSSSSSNQSSSSSSSANLAGAWKSAESPIVLHLQGDGSVYMTRSVLGINENEKKGEGHWSVSGDHLKVQMTMHGAPFMPEMDYQFQQTDQNHLVVKDNEGKTEHWTRQ